MYIMASYVDMYAFLALNYGFTGELNRTVVLREPFVNDLQANKDKPFLF